MLALLMVLALAPGAMAAEEDAMTLGRVSVVMPEIKVEINRTNFSAGDVSATLDTDKLTVEDVHVYDKNKDSACIYVVVDISEPTCSFDELQDDLSRLGKALGLQIRIQKNEIFEAMHQI